MFFVYLLKDGDFLAPRYCLVPLTFIQEKKIYIIPYALFEVNEHVTNNRKWNYNAKSNNMKGYFCILAIQSRNKCSLYLTNVYHMHSVSRSRLVNHIQTCFRHQKVTKLLTIHTKTCTIPGLGDADYEFHQSYLIWSQILSDWPKVVHVSPSQNVFVVYDNNVDWKTQTLNITLRLYL